MKKTTFKSVGLSMALIILGFKSFSQGNPKTPFMLKIANVKNANATIHIGFYKKENNFPTQQQHAFAKEFNFLAISLILYQKYLFLYRSIFSF